MIKYLNTIRILIDYNLNKTNYYKYGIKYLLKIFHILCLNIILYENN